MELITPLSRPINKEEIDMLFSLSMGTLAQAVAVLTVVIGVLWGYFQLQAGVSTLEKNMDELKKSGEERAYQAQTGLKELKHDIDSRILPLESEVKVNSTQYATLAANFAAIQASLQGLNTRFDALITHLLKDKM